jgi:hypothetical protein
MRRALFEVYRVQRIGGRRRKARDVRRVR